MASSQAPTTPDNAPRRMLMNRSVTAPTRTSPAAAKPPPEIGATEGVETLYTHPNASIVKFTTLSSRPSSSSPGKQQHSETGTLPWSSVTERTVAAGPLQVYRVPGSVSFLNSGKLLHAVLPKSQCWCVDGISKFALRVLPDTYYRIELPGETEEDKLEVEKLKDTLRKVCHYERTPCPFDRGFDVELQSEPHLEVRKKRRKSHGPAKKWRLDKRYSWKPEGWQPAQRGGSGDEVSGAGSSAGSEDESESVSGQEDNGGEEKTAERADQVKELKVATPSRVRTARTLLEQRSVTAPVAQLPLQSPPPSRLRTRVDVDGTIEVTEPAVEGAIERPTMTPRTFQAIPTDMPPSPPDSSAGMDHLDLYAGRPAGQSLDKVTETREHTEGHALTQFEGTIEGADDDETNVTRRDEGGNCTPASESHVDGSHDVLLHDEPPQTSTRDSQEAEVPSDAQALLSETIQQMPPTLHCDNFVAERRQSDPFAADEPASLDGAAILRSSTPPSTRSDDPFAAIQARILARRSIGGTISFHPHHPPPTRQSTSSSSSNATVSSTLSRRSHSSSRHQQAFATAMVKKACSVFLGPPAHLVAIMLKIAARFARGAFGMDSVFYVESPASMKGRVPGSYQIFANGNIGSDELDAGDDELDEWEDDFGVPLRTPVRLFRSGSAEGLRERDRAGTGRDVD